MLFPRTNSKTGAKFMSGYVEIDGKKVQVVMNKAKNPDKDGNAFYVLFENTDIKDKGAAANLAVTKSKVLKKGAAKLETADEESPF